MVILTDKGYVYEIERGRKRQDEKICISHLLQNHQYIVRGSEDDELYNLPVEGRVTELEGCIILGKCLRYCTG